MKLNEYQRLALETDRVPEEGRSRLLVPILGLAGEVGELLGEYKKHLRDGDAYQLFDSRVEEELGDTLWYIAAVAERFGLDLEGVAAANLRKCRSNWVREFPRESVHGRFDSEFPPGERFPEKLMIRFEEIDDGKSRRVRATWKRTTMGEPLTDNSADDDGYRFHDIFHLACAAGLGWSPVTRRNLKLKRRSDEQVDEVEDGGRAIVIEEGISALVFSYAVEHDWLRGVDRVDHDILKMIQKMTGHLEVAACSIAEWEETILMAFPVWRRMMETRGGFAEVDLTARSIRYEKADR